MMKSPNLPIVALWIVFLPLMASGQEFQQDTEPKRYDSSALSLYLEGDLFVMQDDYESAARAYAEALRHDSSSATIYLSLGEALVHLGQHHKAWWAGQRALSLEPEDPEVHQFLADVAAKNRDIPTAIMHLEAWGKYDPTDIEPYFRKAALYLQEKQYDQAIDAYIAIYDRDPLQEQVLPRAGDIALSLKDFERGYEVYRRLKEIKPDDPHILRTFAEMCLRTNRNEEAITAYQALEASGRASLGNRLQLAWLYRQAGQVQQALATINILIDEGHRQWDVLRMGSIAASELEEFNALVHIAGIMLDVYPDSLAGYTAMAIGKSNLDDNGGAIEVLKRALSRVTPTVDVHYFLGSLYYSVENFMAAEMHLLAAKALVPNSRNVRQLLASVWSEMRNYSASDSLYERLLSDEKNDAVSLNNYAYSIADREQVTRKQLKYARKLSKRSLKRDKNNPAFLDTYGWIWFHLGRTRQAHKYIARSLAVRGDSPEVLGHMAAILKLRGKDEEARIYADKAEAILRQQQELVRAESSESAD